MSEARMLAEIMIELHVFFDSNMNNVEAWLKAKNLNLGGCSPMQLIKLNKTKKLYQFVMGMSREV